MYDDAQVTVLEEALPFPSYHKSKGIIRKRNPEHKSYDHMD
jgi:hypothetical protein